jgi:hypothetical protein
MKKPAYSYSNFFRHLATLPFIAIPMIPTILLHITIEIYQQIAFPLYGLKKFRVGKFVSFDRERLTYLKGLQWWYCAYCTYMNGIFAYFVAIAGKTEEYWCNVIHADVPGLIKQPHQHNFAPYGDEQAFAEQLRKREEHRFR